MKGSETANGIYNLKALDCEDPEALIKYLRRCSNTKIVDLSDSKLTQEFIVELGQELHQRDIMIEDLNLSNIEAINDELVQWFAKKLFEHNADGTSSSVNKLTLNQNNISRIGLVNMLDATAQNTLLREISVRDCQIEYTEEQVFDWRAINDSLSRNCGIIKIDLADNDVAEDLLKQIEQELDKNRNIVEQIFPQFEEREKQFLRKKVKQMKIMQQNGGKGPRGAGSVGLMSDFGTLGNTFRSKRTDRVKDGSNIFKSKNQRNHADNAKRNQTMITRPSIRRRVAFIGDDEEEEKQASSNGQ